MDENPRTGSTKLPGAILNVRLLHGPEGVSPMDGTNIPAPNQTTYLSFRKWPFLLVDLDRMRTHYRVRQNCLEQQ